jgi:aspartyl-tRNA(Asn)/glutamyl-tRNA(Gln) amidotransferase subunit B
VQNEQLGSFFEEVIEGVDDTTKILLASNYIANDIVSLKRDTEERDTEYQSEIPISAGNFKIIIDMLSKKKISSRGAKDILAESIKTGADPETIAKDKNLYQVSAGADFEAIVAGVIAKNPSVVCDYNSGKAAALEFLVGQSMKALKGAGDPAAIRDLLTKKVAS